MTTGDATSPEPSGHRPPGEQPTGQPDPAAGATPPPPQWQPPGQQQYQAPGTYPPPGQQPPGMPLPPPEQGYGQGYPPPGGYQAPGYQAPGYQAQGYQQAPYGYGQPPGVLTPQDERTWVLLAHLSGVAGPFVYVSFIGPLIVMLVQGPKSPTVRAHAVEALNFNLSMLIYYAVSTILTVILIGIVGMIVVAILWLVFAIIAAVKVGQGEPYRYPLTIRMVS